MLPFLKSQQESGDSGPIESMNREPDNDEDFDSLEVAMKELFNAKNDKARAAAFRAAFDLLEQEPHEEAGHDQ